MKIPTVLASVLENCTDADSEEIWEFLDSDPDAVGKMIDLNLKSHPGVVKADEQR